MNLGRRWWLGVALGFAACFSEPTTIGLPCSEDAACFDGQVCGPQNVCVDPSDIAETSSGDGDGDPTTGNGDGDGASGDGDGDGDGASGDGDGDGDGDGTSGDGDGDGSPPMCGNGIREGSEVCDGNDFGDTTCADYGFGGGTLVCNDCQVGIGDCCLGQGQECNSLDDKCCGNLSCGGLLPMTCM